MEPWEVFRQRNNTCVLERALRYCTLVKLEQKRLAHPRAGGCVSHTRVRLLKEGQALATSVRQPGCEPRKSSMLVDGST